ncbi:MAG: hypothetical protein ACRDZ8_19600 [Acidimicrobiales bacterium]
MVSDSEKERVRLVEIDYDRTNDFIKSVLTTAGAMRGLGVTLWLGLVGFAVQQGLWELGVLAAVVAVLFLFLDGYHGWLYEEALKHARAAEKVTSRYYDFLSRGDADPDALLDFREELRFHRFGLWSNLRHFAWRDLLVARPPLLYRIIYPSLVGLAVAVAILVGAGVIGK